MTAARPAAKAETNSPPAPFAAAGTDDGLAFRCRDLAIDVGDERRRIIAGLDLEVPRRQFLCILGESGVGKTTLLRVFGGLAPAAPGSTLELNGQPIVGPPDGAVFVPVGAACVSTAVVPVAGAQLLNAVVMVALVAPTPQVSVGVMVPPGPTKGARAGTTPGNRGANPGIPR